MEGFQVGIIAFFFNMNGIGTKMECLIFQIGSPQRKRGYPFLKIYVLPKKMGDLNFEMNVAPNKMGVIILCLRVYLFYFTVKK
jgi:hypothetical protein